jgi:hypothetical protein
MTPSDLKPHVLAAVKLAAEKHSAVKFREVATEVSVEYFDDRNLDKHDPKTGKARKPWLTSIS